MEKAIIFREARSLDELVELFRLRHRLIRETRHRNVLGDADRQGYGIDAYDSYGYHFGLYEVDATGERVIGYQRGVTTEEGPAAGSVRRMAVALTGALPARPTPYPFMTAFEGEAKDELDEYASACHRSGARLVESGMFCIERSRQGVRAGRFFVEAVLAAYLGHLGFASGITLVSVHHELFYRRAGFKNLLGRIIFCPKASQDAAALVVDRDSLAPRIRTRIDAYTAQMAGQGFISLDAASVGAERSAA